MPKRGGTRDEFLLSFKPVRFVDFIFRIFLLISIDRLPPKDFSGLYWGYTG